jgi:hypothetical protein
MKDDSNQLNLLENIYKTNGRQRRKSVKLAMKHLKVYSQRAQNNFDFSFISGRQPQWQKFKIDKIC